MNFSIQENSCMRKVIKKRTLPKLCNTRLAQSFKNHQSSIYRIVCLLNIFEKPSLLADRAHFRVIGIIRPLPNDFSLTLSTNPICQRLCSALRIAALL